MTIDQFIDHAIAEDIGDGDHTSLATIPETAVGRARLLVKENGVIAGVELATRIFNKFDPELKINVLIPDGNKVSIGDFVFTVEGKSRSILTAERLVLNFMQRMSGIASKTREFVDTLDSNSVRILDTRKTTPGLRFFEKEAVRIGGGTNHRMGLYDMIMIKDNHIDFAGGIEEAISSVKDYMKQRDLDLKVEIESRNLDELKTILDHGGVDRIMLDNYSVEDIQEAVEMIGDDYEIEISGNVTLDNLKSYDIPGVDFISTGAITHSSGSIDLSLKAY